MNGRFSFGSSVVKREAKTIDKVDKQLKRDGWQETSRLAGGRLRYYEQSGVNLTALEGPLGTVIFPSGPLRGKFFGELDMVSRASVIGAGKDSSNNSGPKRQPRSTMEKSGNKTI